MGITSKVSRRASDIVLLVAGLLLVGLLAVPAMLPSAAAQTEGPSTTSSTTTTSGESTTTTTEAPTTTTAPPAPVLRPDAMIRRHPGTNLGGNNVYSTTKIPAQTRLTKIGWRGTASFVVRIQNDGSDGVPILVQGPRGNANYTVRYRLLNGGNITTAVVNDGYEIAGLNTAQFRDIVVDITGTDRAIPGSQRIVWVRAKSGSVVDRAFAVAKRPVISAEQNQIRNQINTTRRQNGRAPLAMHPQLAKKAQAWAERMARNLRLSHSSLAAGVPAGWTAVAENVGRGSTLPIVHRAFLRSSGHRGNILGPYNYVGTGQARRGGNHWVVHVFMRR